MVGGVWKRKGVFEGDRAKGDDVEGSGKPP